MGQVSALGIYLEQQHGRQHALLLFSTALEPGFLQEFPFLTTTAKGSCCICNQKKTPWHRPSLPWAHLAHYTFARFSSCAEQNQGLFVFSTPGKQSCQSRAASLSNALERGRGTKPFVVLGGFSQQFSYFLIQSGSKWGLRGSVPLLRRAGAHHFTKQAWQAQAAAQN